MTSNKDVTEIILDRSALKVTVDLLDKLHKELIALQEKHSGIRKNKKS